MKRKPTEGRLTQVMFRLSREHIEALDALASSLSASEGTPKSRTDAVRWLIQKYARQGRR